MCSSIYFTSTNNFTGVRVNVKGEGEVTCKARLLFALADLPAKAALFNITQFNGKFGCPTCKQEGEQVCSNCTRFKYYIAARSVTIMEM